MSKNVKLQIAKTKEAIAEAKKALRQAQKEAARLRLVMVQTDRLLEVVKQAPVVPLLKIPRPLRRSKKGP